MPSASEAQQNDVEGGEDYPDGKCIFVHAFYHFLVTKYQDPPRSKKKLKIYYVWILHMKKLRQHSGKFMIRSFRLVNLHLGFLTTPERGS